jgi:hypothetical protein
VNEMMCVYPPHQNHLIAPLAAVVVVCGAMLLMNVIDDGTSKLDFMESTG